ncbi:regulator [Streptomyces sp. LP05-1]|uniref:Regulator n=1 Tax=Streptomyces pyxinae TaxID=2970734 RepID=A0ABT2CQK5_9ACTN|nr:regulator [Streptomyces sp. LP05-1]MCS0639725.1 regulator [Streptomyces sp. LP05-1]
MRRSDLPARPGRLIGRDDELAAVRGLLARSRLVTVVGTGGVGKSRLVARLAEPETAEGWGADGTGAPSAGAPAGAAGGYGGGDGAPGTYGGGGDGGGGDGDGVSGAGGPGSGGGPGRDGVPDAGGESGGGGSGGREAGGGRDGGARVAELDTLGDPALLAQTLLDALGLTDHTSRPPRAVLSEWLAGRRTLLVLDGVERLAGPCAALVRELLAGAPGLTVLAAGRRPLGLPGEAVLPLAPLAEADAVRLFTDRAAAAVPDFRPGDPAAVRELCRRLDGIPLAVELAAGRLPGLSVAELLDRLGRLDDRFGLLAGGAPGRVARHRTLRTAIGWSHELCTPAERLLWARLSVFAGPFDPEAVGYVCAGPELPADRMDEVLAGLVAQSVVVPAGAPGDGGGDGGAGPCYRMLETVRAYGAEWLARLGDEERMRRRHRDWYVGLAAACELEWFGPRQAEVAARLDAALPHLRTALELCLSRPGDERLAQHLAGTLWFYWAGCGRLAEGRHWLDRAVARGPRLEPARLKALWVLGYVAVLQGDTPAARAALDSCASAAERTGNASAAAYAAHRLGCLALVSDDMARAEELLGRALDAYHTAGELNTAVLMARVELAMAKAFLGDLPAAEAICREVRAACEERGERWTRAYALYVLAYAAWTRGEFGEARTLLRECVTVAHTLRDRVGLVLVVELLALVAVDAGDPDGAAVLHGAAGPMWAAVGLPLFGSAHFGVPRELGVARARAALGAEAFRARTAEGAQLSLDAAVARALAATWAAPAGPSPGAADRPAGTAPGVPARPGRLRTAGETTRE